MKLKPRFIKYFLLLISAPILFTSCEKELDHPPKTELNQDAVMTLSEIRNLYDGEAIELDSGSNVFAVINMDESTGNIYRSLFVQDSTAAINLRLTSTSFFQEGDSVRISLDGTTLDSFNGMLQLNNVDPDKNIIRQASGKHLTPEVVSIPDITPEKQGQLVKLENVQFVSNDAGVTYAYADEQMSENRDLMDIAGNTIIVRTSGYADFADELTPEGSGSLIAVVSQYFDDMQLFIRTTDEVVMEEERFEIELPDGTFDDPYSVANAIAFNTGNDIWVEGYITGVMETTAEPFEPSFEPPFETTTNVIIADDPEETSLSNSLIVQLPFGDVRTAVNLVDNPGNHGKEVKLLGDLEPYFGQPGMRNTSDYWLDDDNDDDNGDDNGDVVTSIDEDFQGYADHAVIDKNGWTAIAQEGERKWICRTHEDNHYAQATAFNSPDPVNIMWMITPPVDLDAIDNPILEFHSAQAFYTHDGFEVFISSDFDGTNVEDADWQTLPATLAGEGDDDHEWIDSGVIDLSVYSGIIHIAWRYEAEEPEGKTGTFRVNNVKLYDNN